MGMETTPGQSIETPCSWVAAADFNRDGRPDIAVGVVRDDMGTFDNQVVVFWATATVEF